MITETNENNSYENKYRLQVAISSGEGQLPVGDRRDRSNAHYETAGPPG